MRCDRNAARATLDGVTIDGNLSLDALHETAGGLHTWHLSNGADGVYVGAGRLQIQNCTIIVPVGRTGVTVYGPTSAPIIADNVIKGGATGIAVMHNAGGLYVRNTITGCSHRQVELHYIIIT